MTHDEIERAIYWNIDSETSLAYKYNYSLPHIRNLIKEQRND